MQHGIVKLVKPGAEADNFKFTLSVRHPIEFTSRLCEG